MKTTLPVSLVAAIAKAVSDHHGTIEDVEDAVHVWERVQRVNGERADRIRRQVRELPQIDEGDE